MNEWMDGQEEVGVYMWMDEGADGRKDGWFHNML